MRGAHHLAAVRQVGEGAHPFVEMQYKCRLNQGVYKLVERFQDSNHLRRLEQAHFPIQRRNVQASSFMELVV